MMSSHEVVLENHQATDKDSTSLRNEQAEARLRTAVNQATGRKDNLPDDNGINYDVKEKNTTDKPDSGKSSTSTCRKHSTQEESEVHINKCTMSNKQD